MTELNAAERMEFDRERDSTPVDEAWARLVAETAHDKYGPVIMDFDLNKNADLWISFRNGRIILHGNITVENPTRGQVRTAARLFHVQLKEGV